MNWDNWKPRTELSVHQELARRKPIPQRSSSVSEYAKVGVRILSEDVLSCFHGSLHLTICLRVDGEDVTWTNPQSPANCLRSRYCRFALDVRIWASAIIVSLGPQNLW